MAVQITFYRLSEKKPEHYEEIIWLKNTTSYGIVESFEPRELSAEYCWFEVDEDGNQTGNQCCYTDGDGDILKGHVLEILFKGYIAQPEWLWCSVEDYWNALDTEIKIKE